ncbi:MAG TPA: hypothetical protein PLS53_17940 [Thermoanaerobaculaceae bacterium]|nr:hypothetical protein [Thermoanaerobaculaceae bacterium]HPS80043.1 hypothetical protein [Thermoanaerobaculaceae bacterium]
MTVIDERWIRPGASALLAVALVLMPSAGLVWCHGPDGHLRLEHAASACCRHDSRLPRPGDPGPGGGTALGLGPAGLDECAGCVDTPLSFGAELAAGASDVIAGPTVVDLGLTSPILGAGLPPRPESGRGAGPLGSPPTVLRS